MSDIVIKLTFVEAQNAVIALESDAGNEEENNNLVEAKTSLSAAVKIRKAIVASKASASAPTNWKTLTSAERRELRKAAHFVLAGELPESHDQQVLMDALEKLS